MPKVRLSMLQKSLLSLAVQSGKLRVGVLTDWEKDAAAVLASHKLTESDGAVLMPTDLGRMFLLVSVKTVGDAGMEHVAEL
jgi:hypothetical protein